MFRLVAPVLALLALLAAAPVGAQDAAELLLRVNRLEGQLRQMAGQIEQLQFQNRKLEDQLRKFQQDVEFRFQEHGGAKPTAQAPGIAAPAGPAGQASAATPGTGAGAPTVPGGTPAARRSRGDAFDPASQPEAPGAPRVLGGLTEPVPAGPVVARGPDGAARTGSGIAVDDDASPLDLSAMARGGPVPPPTALPPAALPPAATASVQPAPVARQSVATAGTGVAKDDYDLAYGLVLQRQYEQAEMAFRHFLQTWPRDRNVAAATYWLGETYFRRGRYPDAVEQYLKIYKAFGKSSVAPDSMLKMALSLRGMGQAGEACKALAEISNRYPGASAEVRAGVERELKRGGCS